ncbi:MAG: hypothetical protein WCT39_03375, partial [Candidatus Margulisiibacteriota bacterium]
EVWDPFDYDWAYSENIKMNIPDYMVAIMNFHPSSLVLLARSDGAIGVFELFQEEELRSFLFVWPNWTLLRDHLAKRSFYA